LRAGGDAGGRAAHLNRFGGIGYEFPEKQKIAGLFPKILYTGSAFGASLQTVIEEDSAS
jgi:hypothetical protein